MNMTTEQRLKLFKEKGWSYNKETKELISAKNHVIDRLDCTIVVDGKKINATRKNLIIYLQFGYYKQKRERSITSVLVTKRDKRPTVNYINDAELTYEIIISKGKGYLTEKAHLMLYKIATNLTLKFNYYNEADRYDCILSGYVDMINGWQSFNEEKYSKSFPYFTEIAKRGLTKGIKTDKKTISLSRYNNSIL